jgi:hypothetical protein
LNGCTLTPEDNEKIKDYISNLEINFKKSKHQINNEEIISNVKAVPFNDNQYLADLDSLIDKYTTDINNETVLDEFKLLISKINKSEVKDVIYQIKRLKEEYEEIHNCSQLQESYHFLNKVQIKKMIKFLMTIIDYASYIVNKNKIEKPSKKKKIITASKKISNLQYCAKDETLMVVSVNPEKIIGAKVIWSFNRKYRDLVKYTSDEGFDVKGTTLINGTSAISKKIRKPEVFLKQFMHGTKLKQDKDFIKIVGREKTTNYRFNSDMILLITYNP